MTADLKVPEPLRRDKRSSENAVSADPVSIPVRRDARLFEGIHKGSGNDSTNLLQVPPSPSSISPALATDPVCGQHIEPKNAPKAVFNDKPYYFCHANCKNQFDQDPQLYIGTRPDNRSLNNSSDKPDGLTPPVCDIQERFP
jgi:YHS domain-containing protein